MATPEEEKPKAKKPKPGEKEEWKPKAGAKAEQLAAKKSSQFTPAAVPDVTKTPAAPSPTPIPFPAVGKASDTDKGTKKVKIKGKDVKLKDKSLYKKSKGDEAATKSFGMGVISHKIQSKQQHAAWAMDVKTEGTGAVRFMDLTTGSGSSAHQGGARPSQTKVKVQAGGSPEYLKHPKDEPKKKEPADKARPTKDGKKVIQASRKKKLEVPLDTDTLGALTDRVYEKLESEAAQERDVTGRD
jgi:hypothetical protein